MQAASSAWMANKVQASVGVERALRTLISDGLAYLVIHDESNPEYFIQFAPGYEMVTDAVDDLYAEAVSSTNLGPGHTLDRTQEAALRRLGWTGPTDTYEPTTPGPLPDSFNWWRYFDVPSSQEDFDDVVTAVVETFAEVYASDGADLRAELAPHRG